MFLLTCTALLMVNSLWWCLYWSYLLTCLICLCVDWQFWLSIDCGICSILKLSWLLKKFFNGFTSSKFPLVGRPDLQTMQSDNFLIASMELTVLAQGLNAQLSKPAKCWCIMGASLIGWSLKAWKDMFMLDHGISFQPFTASFSRFGDLVTSLWIKILWTNTSFVWLHLHLEVNGLELILPWKRYHWLTESMQNGEFLSEIERQQELDTFDNLEEDSSWWTPIGRALIWTLTRDRNTGFMQLR